MYSKDTAEVYWTYFMLQSLKRSISLIGCCHLISDFGRCMLWRREHLPKLNGKTMLSNCSELLHGFCSGRQFYSRHHPPAYRDMYSQTRGNKLSGFQRWTKRIKIAWCLRLLYVVWCAMFHLKVQKWGTSYNYLISFVLKFLKISYIVCFFENKTPYTLFPLNHPRCLVCRLGDGGAAGLDVKLVSSHKMSQETLDS